MKTIVQFLAFAIIITNTSSAQDCTTPTSYSLVSGKHGTSIGDGMGSTGMNSSFNSSYFNCFTTDISIDEISRLKMHVYPNPVNDVLTISIDQKLSGGVKISLHDHNGKLVLKKSFQPEQNLISIDTKALVPAVYLLRISDKSNTITNQIRIIKM